MGELHDVPVKDIYKALNSSEDTRWDVVKREQPYVCEPEIYGEISKNGQYQGEIDVLAKDNNSNTAYVLEVKSNYDHVDEEKLKSRAGRQLQKAKNHFEAQGWQVKARILLNGHETAESFTLNELEQDLDWEPPKVVPQQTI